MTATPEERYPLWCVDTGDKFSEERYRGPYHSEKDANDDLRDLEAFDEHYPDARIRRCRRLLASEVPSVRNTLDSIQIAETADEDMEGPNNWMAWARWDDEIVDVRARVEADQALYAWADEHLTVRIFICEGDEPAPHGRKAGGS